jgi:uncharacterized membrane protein
VIIGGWKGNLVARQENPPMTLYQFIVATHAAIGMIALACFWMAALLRKGSVLHRRVGQVYLLAMVGICITGAPLAGSHFIDGHVVTGAFLSYLLLLLLVATWSGWRAARDKHDVARYTGTMYVIGAWMLLAAGASMMALGVFKASPLIAGFSIIGLYAGYDSLRRRRSMGKHPRWWLREHYSAMFGTGVATHIAFLTIGLPRLLPMLDGPVLHYAAWFAPLLVAQIATVVQDRKHRAAAMQDRSPRPPTPPAARASTG